MSKAGINDIVERYVKENAPISKAKAKAIVNGVIVALGTTIVEEGEVTLVGFGTFKVTHYEAREGFNPRTKEKIPVEASNSVKFKIGSVLKESVN